MVAAVSRCRRQHSLIPLVDITVAERLRVSAIPLGFADIYAAEALEAKLQAFVLTAGELDALPQPVMIELEDPGMEVLVLVA